MKIRIMSDLHIDVNEKFPLRLMEKDRDIFTILAGDIAGELFDASMWIKDNCPYGVYVAGNHLVYNNYAMSLPNLKKILKDEFPESCTMKFLDNSCYNLDDNTIIVGSTLYTDFKLGGTEEKYGMNYVHRKLNDFRWGFMDNGDGLRELEPSDYLNMFNESKAFIEKVCDENPDKNIIVVTHHAPSSKAISNTYRGDISNCGFASDLDEFIKNHSNIKAWIYGHTHNCGEFKIGNCLCINNARGYCGYMEDMNWNPMFYLDTDTWTTSSDEEWFHREMSNEEQENRKKVEDYYNTMFSIYGLR